MKRLSQLLGLQFTGQPDALTPADQRRIRTLLIISWLNLLALLATCTSYLLLNQPIPEPVISHTIPIIVILIIIRFRHYREAIVLFVVSHVVINFFNLIVSDSTNYLYILTSFLSVSMFLSGRKVVIYALAIVFALSISLPLTAGIDRYAFIPRETTIMFVALGIMIVAVVSYVHDGDLKEIEAQAKALRENAARLQSILDSIPGFILTIDDQLRLSSMSSSVFEDTSAASALVGQPYQALIREEYHANIKELLEAALHRSEIGNFEIQGQDNHWYRGRIAPIITDGKAEAVTVIALESTEQKTIDEVLRQYAEEVSDLYNNAPGGYHSVDENGVIVQMNDTELKWLGYERDEVVGKLNYRDLLTPSSSSIFEAAFPTFKERGWMKDIEVDMLRKDGSSMSIIANATAMRDTHGRYLMSRTTVFDVTELKRAEEALRQSEERYKTISQLTSDFFFAFHLQDNYMIIDWLAGAWEGITGYSAAALQQGNQQWINLAHPDDVPRVNEHLALLQANQKSVLDMRLIGNNKRLLWLRVHLYPVWDEKKNELSSGYAAIQDITDYKQAEDAKRIHEERYRLLARNMPQSAVYLFDHNLRYIVAEGAALAQYGFSSASLEGKTLDEALPLNQAQFLGPHIRQALQGKKVNLEFTASDHHIFRIEMVPISDENGEITTALVLAQDITERKKAENALRDSEERYRMISELISDYAYGYRVELDGTLVREWVTDSYTRITGYPIGEVDDQGIFSLYRAGDYERAQADMQATLKGQQTHNEYQIVTKDGEKKWVSISRYPIWDESQNRVVRFYGAAQDITERKAAENALRDSEERFKGAFELSPIGMALVTPEGKWLKVNQSLLEMLGYSEAELLETDFQLITPEDDLKHDLYFAWHLLRDTFQSYRMEKRYIRKDGSVITVLLSVNMVRKADGTPLYAIAQMVDLNELKQKENFLRQSEAQTRALLNAIPDLVFRLSVDGEFLFYKGATEELYVAPDAIIGHTLEELLPLDVVALTRLFIREAVTTGQTQTYEYQLDIPNRGLQDYEARMVASGDREVIMIIRNITDRKQAEAALRESKQRYDELVANIPIMVYRVRRTVDGEYRFDYVSPRVRAINELEPDAILENPVLLYGQIHADEIGEVQRLQELSATTLQPFLWEGRLMINGAQRWMRLESRPDRLANGEVVWDGIQQDITAQKLAEAAVMESNQRYDELVANIPVMVYRVGRRADGQYRYDYVSPRIRDLNEIEPEKMLQDSQVLYDQMHPEDRAEMHRLELAAFNNITPFLWEGRFLIGNRTRWMRIESYPKQLDDGEVVWHGIQQDITAQKEAEIALRHSQRLIEQIARTVPDYIYVVKVAGKELVYVNKHLGLDLGYSVEEVVEYEKNFYADLTHPDDKAQVVQYFRDVTNLPDDSLAQTEFRLQQRDETWRWFYMRTAVYARDAEGEPTQMFVVAQDVTERKTTEQELRIAKDAAETASRTKSIFLANTSHELRTPLNVIIGMSQAMSDDENIPIEARNNITVIHRSGQHLLELINDVLDLSRVEAGRTQVEIQSLDLPQFLQSIRDMMGFQAYNKSLEFGIRFSNNAPRYIKSDEKKLRQVLINLIGNAIKFTDVGFVTVSMDYQPETQELHFKVEDSGCGIAAEEMPKLFEIYNHVISPARTRQGVGLGLALSKKLINLMGGEITATSVLNQGSTFSFYVPITADNIAPIADQPILGVLTDIPYRILVVDDYEDGLYLMSGLLKLPGIETQTASGGQQGIDIARVWKPHLIFMDVQMPVIDGYMATARIRTELPETVIIALTAEMLADSTVFDGAVFKPFRKRLIYETLVKHLNIKYIYDESRTIISDRLDEIGPKDFDLLPSQWRQEFQQAAQMARLDEVQRLIDQIRPTFTYQASKLAELAQRFDFEKLIELASDPDDKA
ncbi:MAG: PAS domain S-box protein [Anaerolineae bacterium]